MTDCYVCGHQILEGQRAIPYEPVINGTRHVGDWLTHENTADHLPTLELTPNSTLVRRGMERQHLQVSAAVRSKERERAAGTLAKVVAEAPLGTTIEEFIEIAQERIRSGE